MKHFFERVRANALDPRQTPVVLAALGDSVTQGVMEHRLLDSSATYHRLLQRELEAFFPTTTFNGINAGVSGDTAAGGLERLERDVIGHNPDLVLIAFGLNDSIRGRLALGDFEGAVREMIKRVREKTSADIVLVTPPFMATRSGPLIHPEHTPHVEEILRAQNDGTLAAYAESLRVIAAKEHLVLADVQAEWKRLQETNVDTNLWLCNGLNHPDPRGHHLASVVIFHSLLCARQKF